MAVECYSEKEMAFIARTHGCRVFHFYEHMWFFQREATGKIIGLFVYDYKLNLKLNRDTDYFLTKRYWHETDIIENIRYHEGISW